MKKNLLSKSAVLLAAATTSILFSCKKEKNRATRIKEYSTCAIKYFLSNSATILTFATTILLFSCKKEKVKIEEKKESNYKNRHEENFWSDTKDDAVHVVWYSYKNFSAPQTIYFENPGLETIADSVFGPSLEKFTYIAGVKQGLDSNMCNYKNLKRVFYQGDGKINIAVKIGAGRHRVSIDRYDIRLKKCDGIVVLNLKEVLTNK
jgi:hypothetical protein